MLELVGGGFHSIVSSLWFLYLEGSTVPSVFKFKDIIFKKLVW